MEQLRTFKSGVQQSLTPIYAMSEKHKVMAWEFMQIMMKTLSETLGSSVTGVYPVAYAEKPLPRRHHVATQTAIPSEETPKKPPSDPDEDDAIPSTVRSRRRRKPIKFIDSDSDEDDGKKAKPPSPKKRNTVKKEQPKKSTTQKSPAVKPSLKVDSPTDVPNKIKTRSKSTGPTPTATAVPEEQDVTPNEKNKETKSTTEESPDEVPEPSVSQPANDDIIDKTDNPTEKDSMNSGGNELKDDSNMTGDSEAKDVGNDDGDDVTQLDEENPPDDAGKKPKKHGRPSSGRTSFTCTICEKTLSTPGNLTVHMRSHSQEKRHNCSKCDKKFITRSNLIRHERTHIGDKPFACEVCGKRYTEKKSVTVHMRQHTGEKPFVCDQCGKGFTQSGILKSHMHTHTGWKGHICDICGRSFRQKSQLKMHIMRHTKTKRHPCTVCGMAFVSPGELRRHHSKHTGERPFLCTICAKSFTRMQYLREHMHQHMGMKPYVCTFKDCGSSYPDVSSYCRHIKKHMKDTNKEAITFVMEKQDDPSSMVYLVQTPEGNLEHVSNAVDIAPRVDQVQVKMETNITNPQVADNGPSQSDKKPEHVLYKLDNGQTIMYINTEEGEQTMVQIQDVPESQMQAENRIEVYNEGHVQTVQTVTSMANTANSFIPNLDPTQKIVFLDSGGITDGEQVGTGTTNIDGATNSIELAIPSGSEIPPSQQPCTQVAMNHGGVMYIDSTAVQGQSEEVHILDTQETVASEALMHLLASGGWKPQNQT